MVLPLPGASSQDSGLRTAGDVSADSGDGESESKEGAASVENEQGIEFSSGSSVGGSVEYGLQNDLGISTAFHSMDIQFTPYSFCSFICLSQDRVSLSIPGCPGTCSGDWATL